MLYVASLAEACVRTPGAAGMRRPRRGRLLGRRATPKTRSLVAAGRACEAPQQHAVDGRQPRARVALESLRQLRPPGGRGGVVSKLKTVTPAEKRAAAVLYAVRPGGGRRCRCRRSRTCAHRRARALDPRVADAHALASGTLMAERASLLTRPARRNAARAVGGAQRWREALGERAGARASWRDRISAAKCLQAARACGIGTTEQRNRAAAIGEQYVVARAREGEIVACEALGRSLAIR